MTLSTWIPSLCIYTLLSMCEVGGIILLYGSDHTLYCGDSDATISPGDWYRNGSPLKNYSRSYIITNATFDDNGEYQCKRNGTNAFTSPLLVDVYGLLHITPLHCNLLSDGMCVKHVKLGPEPFTICANYTTIPPIIPQGKHVITVSYSLWSLKDVLGYVDLYTCSSAHDFCIPRSYLAESSLYSNVSESCLTINSVDDDSKFKFTVYYHQSTQMAEGYSTEVFINVISRVQKVLYGKSLTIYCGDSDPNTPPGNWYHDGAPLDVFSSSYTIANATFDDDGEYQCRRNGTNVSSFPLLVNVYGSLKFIPLNCNSLSHHGCVKQVKRGQSVALCISHIQKPDFFTARGKHSIIATVSYWYKINTDGIILLYSCSSESCTALQDVHPSDMSLNYTRYSDVSFICLVVKNVQEYEEYRFSALVEPRDIIFHNNVDFYVTPEDIAVVYGTELTLYCGDSGHDTPPGDWYHDGVLLGVYSRSYTIANAAFEDDGEYQCSRNGRNVFSTPLKVFVYGLQVTPLKCNAMYDRVCLKHIKRGQSVTLCVIYTTIPSTIPKDKPFATVTSSSWEVHKEDEEYFSALFKCNEGVCSRSHSNAPDFNDWYVNNTCITINNVQRNLKCDFTAQLDFDVTAMTTFIVTCEDSTTPPTLPPQPNDSTANPFVIAFSTSIITIAIVIMIIISTVLISVVVKRYKRSRYTALPSESEVPLEEVHSSSQSNLTVYREKDVKKLEKIGRGSFWKVYRGKMSDTRCAIKRLRGIKKSGNRERLIQKVMKELDTWSSLNHPNILRLYGIYHEESDEEDLSIPSLIVELMDQSLTDHINRTSDPINGKLLFPLKAKISILTQVAGALEYLHCFKNVVHGDLTANNVLLKEISTGSFTAKLTDFGMSRVLDDEDNIMSSVQGTYSYMPPEVHNDGQTSTKVDIYSFGVLCVHILSHKFPKPLHALRVDQAGTHVVVSEFNRFRPYLLALTENERLLEPLIEECLQYAPEDRLRPVEVIGQLDSIQGRLDLNERRPNTPDQTRPVVHQHFIGPVVSGCTITESNLNVQSVTDCNMNVSTVAEITPLTGPLEGIPQITSNGEHPASGHQPHIAALEDITEV